MTDIRQLLACNIKKNRQKLGLSQAKLAEKANISTQYLAMIELTKKFPSPEKMEQIAVALEIDTSELFSGSPSAEIAVMKLQKAIIYDLQKTVEIKVNNAITNAVAHTVSAHLKNIEIDKKISKKEKTVNLKTRR
jgi:transcriptional regulator with XRE-family HTH domain